MSTQLNKQIRQEASRSFFRIVEERMFNSIKLPMLFSQNYEKSVPDHVLIKIPNGDSWNVKVSRKKACCHTVLYFTNGWSSIVQTYKMANTAMVKFTYDGIKTFCANIMTAVIPTADGVEIDYPKPIGKNLNQTVIDEEAIPYDDGWRYFSKVITSDYAKKLYIPAHFLDGNSHSSVKLEYEEKVFAAEDACAIGKITKRKHERGLNLTGDWRDFVYKYGLTSGRTICFRTRREGENDMPVITISEH